MKWYDEEVAHNLLWMKPGVQFWYRQTAVGPVAVGKIVRVDTKRQYVLCCPDFDGDIVFGFRYRLGLHEPQHMSTYPEDDGKHFTWPKTEVDNGTGW